MNNIIEKVHKYSSVQISENVVTKLGNLVNEMVMLYGEVKSSNYNQYADDFDNNTVANTHKRSDNRQSEKPRLKLEVIKAKLTYEIIEKIFRNYAYKINSSDEIIIRKNWITKGSLQMNLISGGWKRWSTSDSGNICRFIELAENVSNTDALEILAKAVGIKTDFKAFKKGSAALKSSNSVSTISTTNNLLQEVASPSLKNLQTTKDAAKDNWVPYEIVPIDAAKFNPDKDLAFLGKYNNLKISNQYEYKDINGRLIGYAIRTIETKIDKDTGESRLVKQVLPVAYCKNEAKKCKLWKLKGLLLDGYKPFYRIEELLKNPSKSVLIVEGEKTADAASVLFPDLVVISWLGGSQVIDRVNWSLLQGREVIIWPDADEPGMKAANSIKNELLKLTGRIDYDLVKLVDIEKLKLPAKWDLADETPSHLTLDDINNAVRSLLIK